MFVYIPFSCHTHINNNSSSNATGWLLIITLPGLRFTSFEEWARSNWPNWDRRPTLNRGSVLCVCEHVFSLNDVRVKEASWTSVMSKQQVFIYHVFLSFLDYVYECFVCIYLCTICVPDTHGCQKRCWISWTWSYKQLWADMWVLGNEPGSSARAASAQSLSYLSSPVLCSWLWKYVL